MKIFGQYMFLVICSFSGHLFSQNTTINQKTVTPREATVQHKVLLVPFEPKLYLSEIDHNINAETKLTAREIKFKFRDGINDQLYRAFKNNKYNVVDLMEDTTRYKKDTEGIYQYLSYEYQKVPDQNNYQPPKKEKEEKKIEKGQLNVESDMEARFMNAKLTNAKVVPMMYGKYKTDLFVFINQLEIKAGGSKTPGELGAENNNRKIVLHYTVYTYDAKEINSGIAETDFETTLNNPKKIIDKYFSKLAEMIVQRTIKGLDARK
jgi:hypothetical protein